MEPRDVVAKSEKKLPVMEIFGPTIQGEGFVCGTRTSFIRFGLCDYKCRMCDSLHAVDPKRVKANADWLTQSEIATRLASVHKLEEAEPVCDWVTFSGGNPCIHNLTELVYYIRGFDILGIQPKIAVETQGTFDPDWLYMCDVITCSPKSPGMGEQFEEDKFVNFLQKFHKHPGFNVKVVIFSMQDIEWVRHINQLLHGWNLQDRFYLSLGNSNPPGMDTNVSDDELKLSLLRDFRVIAEDLLSIPDLRNAKFFPQMHVLAWGNKQGV